MQATMRNERIICRLFLRHRCSRGNTCPFNHPEYNLNPDSPTVSWLNFCEDFKRGQCFQQDCRYFHVTREEEEAYRLRKDIAPTLLEQAMCKALLLEVALTGTRATCKGFLRGGCSSPMCPYRHVTRQEFATEVLDTLRNEFEVLFGPSGTDIPGSQQLPVPPVNNMNNPPLMNSMMPGMGAGQMPASVNVETEDEKRIRLERENEEIYRALDPNQKLNSIEEIRARLLTLQAALQWKDENDTNKGGFIDDGLPPGMAVVNYGHSDTNVEEPSIDFMRRRDPIMPLQPDQGNNRLDQESDCKLFIGGLDTSTETDTLRDYFSRFGEIVDAVVMRHKKLKKSRGFGFVTYSKMFMAENAQRSGPHRIDGKVVDTKFAKPRSEDDRPSSPQRRDRTARSPNREENRVPKLFIGGLKDDITTDVLQDYFGRYGRIVDAISMQDPKTRRSRGFGFVEFEDDSVADRVLGDIPHRILGCTVTVDRPMPRDGSKRSNAPKDVPSRGGDSGNVPKDTSKMFVGGLNFSTKEQTLKDYFSRYGNILEAKIQRDNRGASKGYGFITFSDSYMVEDAIDNGPHEIDGRRVDAGFASRRNDAKKEPQERPRERRKSPDYTGTKLEEEDGCKLYIGNVPKDLSEEAIENYFIGFGDVLKVEVKTKQRGPTSYGFVTFDKAQSVEVALGAAPHEIDGSVIEVGKALTKGKEDKNSRDDGPRRSNQRPRDNDEHKSSNAGSDQPCKLFVGNLGFDATEEALYDHFSKYGDIRETKVTTKGYAFITFADEVSVQEAMEDGPHEIDGREAKLGSAFSRNQDRRDGDNRRDRSPDSSSRRKAEKRKAEKRSHLD